MLKYLKNIWFILKETIGKFIKDNPMSYSAAIAFYTIFSLPGILMVTVAIAGTAYDAELVQSELFNQIEQLIGPQSAQEINKVLLNIEQSGEITFAKTIGIVTLLFSATTVFVSLQEGLNKIWGIKAKPKYGFLKLMADRLLSLALIISIGFLLLVSLVADALLVLFNDQVADYLSGITSSIVIVINILLSLAIITLIFAAIFKVLPDAKIKWRDVWVGAFITTLLFTLGKYLIGFYLGTSTVGTTYGAAGSFILLLVWIYFSTTILLLGAEFTFVYSKHIGSVILPGKGAVKVVLKEEEKKQVKVNE
ncbi:MAG: YihY/virulence factor BrkB family protein [Candidatus Cyclobacteriaceae bacterium M2_1C_046]